MLNLYVLSDITIDDKNFERFLELRIAKLENSNSVTVVFYLFDGRPFQVNFGEQNNLLLSQSDAEVIETDEALDEMRHQ